MRSSMSARIRLALLALLCTTPGCEGLVSDFERHPDEVPRSEIIDLSRAGGDLPLAADGRSRDTLLALIPRGASSRVVTFTTSAGTFALSPGAKEIKVRAEPENAPAGRLAARAVLVADTLPGKAVVSAGVGDFKDYIEVPFVR